VGVTVRFGRFLVRPRIDVFFGQPRTTGADFEFDSDFRLREERYRWSGAVEMETSMKPRFATLSLDVGWSPRR